MNLSELSKLDIKDINKLDYNKIWRDLKKAPEQLLTIVVILASLLFIAHFCLTKSSELRSVEFQIKDLLNKKKAMDEYNGAKKEHDDLLNNLTKGLSEDELANAITTMAIQRGVRLESFSPARKVTEELYELTSIHLDISSKQYDSIFLFIHDVENSPFNLRIETLRGNTMDNLTTQRRKDKHLKEKNIDENPEIRVSLEIASIIFKNENK